MSDIRTRTRGVTVETLVVRQAVVRRTTRRIGCVRTLTRLGRAMLVTALALPILLSGANPINVRAATTGSGYLPFAAATIVKVGWSPGVGGHVGPYEGHAWDFTVVSGSSQIVAASPGTVVAARNDAPNNTATSHPCGGSGDPNNPCAAGNYVILDSGDGTFTQYMHMQQGSVVVSRGQRVGQGQTLGTLGDSGNSSGPHLHFSWIQQPCPPAPCGVQGTGLSIPGSFIGVGQPASGAVLTSNNPGQTTSSDLWFVKTVHTGNGQVEVHSATAASGYQGATHAVTWFSSADANNGTWQMVGQDLYFIKEINTGGHVEVHSATIASGYKSGIHAVTRFSPADAFNGIWQMEGQDLYFIKIRNTGSGRVEVHSATAATGYTSGIDTTTWFSPADAYNGVWQMVGQALYFIKTQNTGAGHVEVHSATATTGYRSGIHAPTWFSSADAKNGTWQIVGQDLFFAKEINTGAQHVEVHSVSAASGYGSGIHASTWFSIRDAYNGAWQIGNRS
jgi:peptidase M23-like protein